MDETASTSTFYVPFLAGGGDAAKARSPRLPPRTRILRRVLYSGLAICTGVALLLIFYSRDASWQASPDRLATVAAAGGAPGGDSDDSFSMLEDSVGESFGRFTVAFGKKYDSDEEKRHRMAVYRRNLMFINMHNRMNGTYTLAMNAFGDMTAEEFRKGYANMKRSSAKDSQKKRVMALDLLKVDPKTLPKEVDWRKKGCVTEVKDQQHCGSCWAFSTTGAMEGAVCAKTGRLPDLSEQQLVDCAGPEGNFGCHGGEADWAFQYVIDNGGLCQETDYPYKAKPSHRCKARDCKNTAEITQFKDVPPHSAHALRAALALHGPVSVAIEADEAYFQFYHRGVFSGVCGIELDHAVLLVGYGTDKETGEDYFILKNSWGASWGEKGYMKIGTKNPERMYKRDGECGLYSIPSFAQA